MKYSIPVAYVFGCILAMPVNLVVRPAMADNASMSRHEIHRLEREANTFEQFETLVKYFKNQEADYRAKAADMKVEWERRSQNISGPSAKAFRPVDSARNLYGYYESEADQADKLVTKYEQRAGELAVTSGAMRPF